MAFQPKKVTPAAKSAAAPAKQAANVPATIPQKKPAAPAAKAPARPQGAVQKIARPPLVRSAGTELVKASALEMQLLADKELFPDNGVAAGFENVTNADKLIPRLTIIQSLSPQRNAQKPEYIEEAEEGDFCDTATSQIWKGSLSIIPVYYVVYYLEWAPRSTGKGLIANHGQDNSILQETERDEKNRSVLPSGNYIAQTATFFVLNVDAGGTRAFIPMTSTQLKSAKKWNNALDIQKMPDGNGGLKKAPMLWRAWVATPAPQSNNDGSWFGWSFAPGEKTIDIGGYDLAMEAKQYYLDCQRSDNAEMMAASVSSGAAAESAVQPDDGTGAM